MPVTDEGRPYGGSMPDLGARHELSPQEGEAALILGTSVPHMRQ
jgi:hypothetical protein